MSKAVPWSIKGVDFDVREAAKEAARRDGVTLGEWMNRAIADRAAEIGVSAQEFDADERLEAVAAQLARLSREAEGDAPPRRRAEPARRQDRERVERERMERERAAVARNEETDWDDDLLRDRAARRRASTERTPPRPAPRDFFARTEAEDVRPSRSSAAAAPAPDDEDAEEYSSGSLARPARAGAPSKADDRLHMRLDERLAEIERRLKRDEKQEIKPLHGMIASVQDRLGEIETRLTKRDRFADDRPLRGALERLEGRIEAMSRRSEEMSRRNEETADEAPLRQLDARLAAILSQLERVEASPPSAAREEQFSRLEKRFDALLTRLDRPAPAVAAPPRRGLDDAVAEIAARQRDLDSAVSRAPRPPSPQLTAMLDERFEALARKFDLAAAKTTPPVPAVAEKARIDLLQNGIQALSGRIEDMRKDFTAAGAHSRAALETLARDLSGRVEAALAAPSDAGVKGLAELRRDISVLSRSLGDVAPRAAVSGLENAMRDLANRVDATREAMLRAASARPEPTSSAELEALGKQVAAMGRTLADLAPRSQVSSLESAVRALSARIERSRDEGMREVVLAPIESLASDVRRALAEAGASANFEGVSHQLQEVESKIEQLRQTGGADRADFLQVFDQSEQIRAMIAQAMEKMAPIERLERQVAGLGERLEDVARQTREANAAQIALPWGEIESRLNDLATRIDRAAFERAPQPAVDDARFDDISRRLEVMHEALASRIDRVAQDRAPAPIADDGRFDDIARRLDVVHEALASRIDRAALDHAPAPGIIDDSRLDDFSRRLDFVHHALASRIDDAEAETRAHAPELESLLRALSEKLDAGPAPMIGAEALESVERRMAEISKRLEHGDTEADRRLQRAIEQITERLDLARDPESEDRNAREIADLREKTESSDRRAQQTLSAVHETLEKVVDRLAMIEEDVIEARGAAEAAARAPATPTQDGRPQLDVHDNDFLMEPGAGRPGERQVHSRAFALRERDKMEPEDAVLGLGARAEAAEQAEAKPTQSNYIDVARRALAARVAAEAAEKFDADKQQRPGAPTPAPASASVAEEASARFVRPLKVSGKGGSRRMPALLFTAVSVLSIGAYQAYRLFDNSTPPMQAVPEPHVDKVQPAAQPPAQAPAPAADASPAKPAESAAPPATAFPAAPAPAAPGPQSSAAPVAMPTATLNSAPIMPSSVLAPKSAKGSDIGKSAGLPDPLATGAIGARPNSLSSIQAGAQAVAIKDMAEKGDPAAQFDYGARLAEGRGVNQDKGAAVGWFERAAAQGLPQAQYRLGAIYEKGVGAPRDPAKARDYYEKAANQGNVRAMHNLAVILAEGVDGKPDYAAAANWFRRAAEYGVRDSQFNLAILYARGMGVPQNLGQSYLWFAVAAQQGDEDAARKRDEVGAQLDAAALGAAKKQVADFHAKAPAPAVNEPPSATVSPGAAASAVSAAVGKALSKI
ncbi:hypothetical protein QM467_14115 [Rhodoblastus sp. 17X3]|uniref:hypothetical protein n=1 Tax=Rhodoblastus sp. 17X3 TaxID=3047026 RepID=UPI0024B68DFC|nr:hypothetical protein [Rhodoblastus sp. 17X3]MDI9849191.1 hypothetical protein [Rhodoblastus sp. 17X3]